MLVPIGCAHIHTDRGPYYSTLAHTGSTLIYNSQQMGTDPCYLFTAAGLLAELESKIHRPEYARLLEECRALYCSCRQQLVSPFVASRLSALTTSPLPGLLRGGTEHLLRCAQLEGQLMEQFFGVAASTAAAAAGGAGPPQQGGQGGVVADG